MNSKTNIHSSNGAANYREANDVKSNNGEANDLFNDRAA